MSRPPTPSSWRHRTNRTKLLRQRSATHARRVGNRRELSNSRPFLHRIPCHDGARQSPYGAAHAQLVAAFSKEMADADGEMLAEYGAMDAMEPLPQETVGRELDMEEATEIDEHQP